MKPEEIPSWEPFLKRIPLFAGLSPEDLGKIAARLQPLSLPKGATLFREGDDPDAMYLIVSGQCRRLRTLAGPRRGAFMGAATWPARRDC